MKVTVAPDALRDFTGALLEANGCDPAQAKAVARILTWCNQMGRPNQGVWRLPLFCRRLRAGLIKAPCAPRFEQLTPAIGRVDGDGGFGHYVAEQAMEKTIHLAEKTGVSITVVHNSNFFGAAGFYVQQAAARQMIGLAMSNAFPKVAAHGGVHPVLGTNPMAFGAPRRHGDTLLLDMATAASAGSTVTKSTETGNLLPEGVAIDAKGDPITDPNQVSSGALLPFGGAKGFGLALMVEILSAIISGSGFSHSVYSMYKDFERSGNNGHFLLAIAIERLFPLEDYFDRMESLISNVKASAMDPQKSEVVLPGENRWIAYEHADRHGIALEDRLVVSLQELAESLEITPPWQTSFRQS